MSFRSSCGFHAPPPPNILKQFTKTYAELDLQPTIVFKMLYGFVVFQCQSFPLIPVQGDL